MQLPLAMCAKLVIMQLLYAVFTSSSVIDPAGEEANALAGMTSEDILTAIPPGWLPPLPSFMDNASEESRQAFQRIITDLESSVPTKQRQIEELISKQPESVRRAYEKFQALAALQPFSLEAELEKIRQKSEVDKNTRPLVSNVEEPIEEEERSSPRSSLVKHGFLDLQNQVANVEISSGIFGEVDEPSLYVDPSEGAATSSLVHDSGKQGKEITPLHSTTPSSSSQVAAETKNKSYKSL